MKTLASSLSSIWPLFFTSSVSHFFRQLQTKLPSKFKSGRGKKSQQSHHTNHWIKATSPLPSISLIIMKVVSLSLWNCSHRGKQAHSVSILPRQRNIKLPNQTCWAEVTTPKSASLDYSFNTKKLEKKFNYLETPVWPEGFPPFLPLAVTEHVGHIKRFD